MPKAPSPTKPKRRRRLQFGLRSFLIAVVVLALGMGWLRWQVEQAHRRDAAVKQVARLLGSIRYDHEFTDDDYLVAKPVPPGPAWLNDLLGVNIFRRPRHLFISGQQREMEIDEALQQAAPHLAELATLEEVYFDTGGFSAAGLRSIAELPNLKSLHLEKLRFDESALAELADCQSLERLTLAKFPFPSGYDGHEDGLEDGAITDVGIRHLAGLRNLRKLNLSYTDVGGEALQIIGRFSQLTELELEGTQVTDASLAHLASLRKLEHLSLAFNRDITDRGVASLSGLNPLILNLYGTRVTDETFRSLAGMDRLVSLNLSGTEVSQAGVDQFQQDHPNIAVQFATQSAFQSGSAP